MYGLTPRSAPDPLRQAVLPAVKRAGLCCTSRRASRPVSAVGVSSNVRPHSQRPSQRADFPLRKHCQLRPARLGHTATKQPHLHSNIRLALAKPEWDARVLRARPRNRPSQRRRHAPGYLGRRTSWENPTTGQPVANVHYSVLAFRTFSQSRRAARATRPHLVVKPSTSALALNACLVVVSQVIKAYGHQHSSALGCKPSVRPNPSLSRRPHCGKPSWASCARWFVCMHRSPPPKPPCRRGSRLAQTLGRTQRASANVAPQPSNMPAAIEIRQAPERAPFSSHSAKT